MGYPDEDLRPLGGRTVGQQWGAHGLSAKELQFVQVLLISSFKKAKQVGKHLSFLW